MTIKGILRNIKFKNRQAPIDDIQSYWQSPDDKGNMACSYLDQKDIIKRSEFLFKHIKDIAKEDNTILEIGCNAGRNLNYLYNKGFRNLSAIEISEKAINLMKKVFPKMYYNSSIKVDNIEESIVNIENNKFDLIFIMAVLMHIPYQSNFIFKEIVRSCNKYLVIIEEEDCPKCWSHNPREYKKIFEGLGMKQIKEEKVPTSITGSGNYILRIFEK